MRLSNLATRMRRPTPTCSRCNRHATDATDRFAAPPFTSFHIYTHLHALAHAKVASRQHIASVQCENRKHVDGPRPNSFDGEELCSKRVARRRTGERGKEEDGRQKREGENHGGKSADPKPETRNLEL